MVRQTDLFQDKSGSSEGGRSVPQFRTVFCLVSAILLPAALGGCPLAIVGGIGAAGGAGYAANQERGAGGTFNDFKIKTDIQSAWLQANPNLQKDFNVTVYEGRVLLTGNAPTPELKAQAQQVATTVKGVRVVYNEIEVASPESVWGSAKDSWISSEVRSKLVFNSQIKSDNYVVETVDRSVYLIGSARSQSELDAATNTARYVPGVKRVVSYIQIRPGMPPGSQPALAAAPAAGGEAGAPAPAAAAPTTPVAAQKL
jgi:osmotically-inducible protein OsmY